MRYSLLAGGKRIRPVLFFAVCDALGADAKQESDFAVALECIHTYSLIHDDLPAMDNDDFRRGKPSNHKVFGEANAILAGDALLSFAFDLLLAACERGPRQRAAARCLSRAAGAEGMIAGQSADLYFSEHGASESDLLELYRNKTARLLSAPVEMGAILADGDTAAAREFGEALGILFQMTDDLLDEKGESAKVGKTLGKDKAENKLTCVRIYGLERSEDLADQYAERCTKAILKLAGENEFFLSLIKSVRSRDH